MTAATSFACPHCRQAAEAQSRVCPHCKREILFDLYLSRFGGDEKELHRLAKDLAAAGSQLAIGSYADLKERIPRSGEALATFLSRAEAEQLSAVLLRYQLPHEIRPRDGEAGSAPGRGRRVKSRLFFALAILLAAAGAVYYFYFLRPVRPHSSTAVSWPLSSEDAKPSAQAPAAPGDMKELQDENLPQEVKLSAQSIRTLIKATVAVTDGQGVGSGFFVDRRGHILTNHHVVRTMSRIGIILADGQQLPAQLVAADPYHDLALLRAHGEQFPTLPLGDATRLNQGDTVWTIGSPHGLNFTLTKGIVSYLGRKFEGKAYIQSDVAINRGNSGGPMLNDQGEVVGINTFIIRDGGAQGLNFALPINYAVMGERAILQPILGNKPENETFRAWARAENTQPPANSSEPPSAPPDSRSLPVAPAASAALLEIYRQDRAALEVFEGKRSQLERDKTTLQAQQLAANNKYQDAAASKTVSEELKLAQVVRDLDLKLARLEVAAQQLQVDFYRSRIPLLRQLAEAETDSARRGAASAEIEKMNAALKVVELNLAAAKQALTEVQARKY